MFTAKGFLLCVALISADALSLRSEDRQHPTLRGSQRNVVNTLVDSGKRSLASFDSVNSVKRNVGERELTGGFFEDILDELLGNETSNEDGDLLDENSTDTLFGDFNFTDSIQNLTDGFDQFTETIQNLTDSILGDLNFTEGSFNISDDGIFGGWNLTGDGIFENLNLTDTISDITDGLFGELNLTDGIFNVSDGLFGELNITDGVLGDLFNNTDGILGDLNLTDGIFGEFFEAVKTSSVFTPALLEGWFSDVVFEDTVCTNTESDPECFDQFGREGFWACRKLTNPFTGKPSETSVCISKGQFLASNDECGCCIPEGSDDAVCPSVCECSCDLLEEGDGVLVTTTGLFGNRTVCVDPRYAVSAVSSTNNVICSDTCNAN